jgi:predicted phage terminase large subunit-like protein
MNAQPAAPDAPPPAAPDAPPIAEGDFISNFEFFRDLFVPENRLELPVKKAHEIMCDTLQDAFLGDLPPNVEYVIIHIGPRIGKTKVIQSTICWAKAYFPDTQNILTSYSGQVAEESLAYIAKTMREEWFLQTFGDLLHSKRADHLTTTHGGNDYAQGTGGSLTGKGAGLKRPGAGGLLIVDDGSKPEEVLSAVEAKTKQRWFETTCKNRRNSPQTIIVLVGQKLGPEDLPGYVLRTYPDKCLVIRLPALVDPVTGEASEQDDAVSAFPETYATSGLLDLRKTRIGRFVLATTYQQRDSTLGGNLIPIEKFGRYDPATAFSLPFERLVIPIDTAMKTKQANDFSACALWGFLKRRAYLIDLLHGKWGSPDLVRNVVTFWEKWKAIDGWPLPDITIEEKAAGTPLLQTLLEFGVPASGIERDIDKVRRVKGVLPWIESGFCLIPQQNSTPWIEKWETEHAQFSEDGTSVHDDMVDTTADALQDFFGDGPSIWDVLRKPKRAA